MISFDGVKVGDRVRLTRTNGIIRERAEFVVTGVESGLLWHESLWFKDVYWDKIKVLSPPKPPLPTEDGVYAPRAANLAGGPLLFTRYQGDWRSSVGGAYSENLARIHMEKSGLVRLVPEGEPSGLLEAARAALVTMKATGSGYGCAASRLSDAIEKAEAQS